LNDIQEYFIHEFVEDYKDGYLDRREMIRKVLYITGGVASTATVLLALGCGPGAQPTPAPATTIAEKPATGTGAAASPVPGTTAGPAVSPSPAAVATPITAGGASPVAKPSPAAAASPSPSPAVARSPLSVPASDPSIEAGPITFQGDDAQLRAYQAKPRGNGPFPLVLVCHENRGLTEHIEDVARRYAKEGYVACAVDLLSRQGGTAAVTDQAQIPGVLSGTPAERHVGDFAAALRHYKSQPIVKAGAYAMTGFCFGGSITWRTATRVEELKAAAPYYGSAPPLEDVKNIKAAVIGVYSSDPNDGANRGRDELTAALRAAGVKHEIKVYPNSEHAFNNDTGPRYQQAAALAAWKDVQDWFKDNLA
jgi:carboxymethylenebutenolidase